MTTALTSSWRPANGRRMAGRFQLVVADADQVAAGVTVAREKLEEVTSPTRAGGIATVCYGPSQALGVLDVLDDSTAVRVCRVALQQDPTAVLIVASCYQLWAQARGHLS